MAEDIAGLAAQLAAGQITAEALLDRCLARIAQRDGLLNSFTALDEPGARAAARASDARHARGLRLSPLDGVPLSVKDNILAAGMPATWGARALATHRPERDELPVARLRAAGAVILGKTNVPELTVEGYTRNDLFGVTRNPWNPALTPGGSSGGAAAGVAARLVPAALGTDGGGSIRRPASHTGLVGWKPSTGHIPRLWGFPTILADCEVIGTLTHTVADAILLDTVLAGADARDRRSLAPPAAPWNAAPRRILFVPRFAEVPVDPEVAAAIAAFADALTASGAAITEAPVFFDLAAAHRAWFTITRAGVGHILAWWPGFLDQAGHTIRQMAEEARQITGADYTAALETIAQLRHAMADLFAAYDLVLTPSAAALPWAAEAPYPRRIAGQAAGPRDHAIFTGWVNLAGLPAISLPVGLSESGLPIGAQLIAGFGQDASLLAFAAAAPGLSRASAPPFSAG